MKRIFATFNVNSVRSRLPVLERWLESAKPHVLCLQETKTQDETFPREFFADRGYHLAFRGQKSYNGVALASAAPPDEVRYGFDDGLSPLFDVRAVSARFGRIWVVNTYVPQGKSIDHEDYQVKQVFFRRAGAMISRMRQEGREVLWVGDLNVAPEEADVTNPENKKNHVCFHSVIRQVFLEARSDMVDVFRKHRPGPGEYSFWDYRVRDSLKRNIGWRIDHILATPDLAGSSSDSWADREPRAWDRPSDHTPVLAAFDL